MESKLLHTSNYAMFVVGSFNRDVRKTGRLMQSMKLHGFIPAYPIHCKVRDDGRLEIKAGHHRFEVAKTLGIHVYYVVTDDAATIPELERATVQWRMADYVNSHARAGDIDANTIAAFAKETGISTVAIASVLAGQLASNHNVNDQVKDGTFTVNPEGRKRMLKIANVVKACAAAGIGFASKRSFVNALSKMCFIEEFDPTVLIHKAEHSPHLFQNCATEEMFLDMIERVHNHARSVKQPLAFMAREAAKRRNRCRKKEPVTEHGNA
jgi:hypothetical protein